jgi:hypothetical protein
VFQFRQIKFCVGVLLLLPVATMAAGPGERVGVADLLRELNAAGLDVLYSSELVPPGLTAEGIASAATPLERAKAALAANGLALRQTGPNTFVVTRAAPALPSPPATVRAATNAAPPSPPTLDDLSVYASRYRYTADAGGEPIEFAQRALEQMPGAKSDSVRALASAPGLASNLSARPYIRGAMLDDVLVEYDGVPLADPYHFRNFSSVLSAFDPGTVGHAEVYTGGFPVSYGTRSGGVIDLAPASMPAGYEAGVSLSFLSVDLETMGHADTLPFDWLLVGRISSDDSVLKRLLSDIGEPRFHDVVGRLQWTFDDDSALSWGFLVQQDQVTFDSQAPDIVAAGRAEDWSTWWRWDFNPSTGLKARTSVALTNTQRNTSGSVELPGIADGTLRSEKAASTIDWRSDWTYAPESAVGWKFGAQFDRENAELEFVRSEVFPAAIAAAFDRPVVADVASNQSPHASTFGAYVAAHLRLRDFEAEVGARADAEDYQGFGVRGQLTPRINLRYDLGHDWHAYGSWGEFSQAERVDEYRGETNQSTPDSASRATHVIGGVMRPSVDSITWRVEAYRHHWSTISPYFDNTLRTLSLLPQLEPDRVLISPADADAVGLELSAQRNFGASLSGWGSYTLSRVTDDTNGREVPRSWDQTHAANAGITWRHSRAAVSALVGWHSGWPRTPLSLVGATTSQPAYLLVGERNSARWGSYFTSDLRLSTSLPLAWGDFSLWFDAANITNRHNECCVDLYAMLDNPAHSTTDLWAPRVVDVGFTLKWRRLP